MYCPTLRSTVSPQFLSGPFGDIDWLLQGILPALVLYARTDDDLRERERRGLEGKQQKAEGYAQNDAHRRPITTAESDHPI
ncbi:hypothetical protein AYO43_09905 [Nitrospira sp. SCGC AG-212-E16]|nr:hypothetical protein AYO43_09905 [Nitrospira sp. SCGC AG-212-E16]